MNQAIVTSHLTLNEPNNALTKKQPSSTQI